MDPFPSSPARTVNQAEVEAEALARAQAGDAEAFRVLVEAYRDRAFGLALRISRSREEAEDATQDAFIRAWRALPRFRGEARFSTWLYRIVMRRALDGAAMMRRRRLREVELEEADAPAIGIGGGTGAGPVGSATGEASARRLEALIAHLPQSQRLVVTLFYYQDRSIEEVARTLAIPEGTVKTHLHRARAALRAAWIRANAGGRDDELLRV